MNILTYAIKKWVVGDRYLQTLSIPQTELLASLRNKSVAIVGNARSLLEQENGAKIDAGDIVVRMHAAPLSTPESHGTRTHWLALGMPIAQSIIEQRAPDRLLWMAKKRKRLRYRFARTENFYLHPISDWDRLAAQLNAPPTTGAMLIDLVTRSQAAQINLFGVDFFQSLSQSGRRTADQVPHDFGAEKQFGPQAGEPFRIRTGWARTDLSKHPGSFRG